MPTPSPSYSFTIRLRAKNKPGMVGAITSIIGSRGGDIGAIDIVSIEKDFIVRDYTVNTGNIEHSDNISKVLRCIKDVDVVNVSDRTFLIHLGGKISIENKVPLNTRDDLSMAYTPGVARICKAIEENRENVYNLTIKKNTIAIVTDGSAVLGLGNIGAEASLPVMEGKAMLFKRFAGINAFPIALNTNNPDEIINIVSHIAPAFGGINLEDISSPNCFVIEKKLSEIMDIPVFHDDQHGTAIVVLAGVINALKLIGRTMQDLKIVISGLGAAGITCASLLHSAGARQIIGIDSAGILYRGRNKNMNPFKEDLAEITNPERVKGGLKDAMRGANLFIGVSAPNILKAEMLKDMATDSIIFALANPAPEIDPEIASKYVRIMATGRSDYQNQINNVLCFPGLFKGLLSCNAKKINTDMKIAASRAISSVIAPSELSEDYIVPSVFDSRVAGIVSDAVVRTAVATGVARKKPRS